MELSPSWEAANCAATQELPSVLWNPKIYYRVNKSPPLVPILSQIDSTIPSHPISLRPVLILSIHLRLALASGLFPSGISINILYAFLFPHSCYMPCPSHPPWNLIVLIILGEEYISLGNLISSIILRSVLSMNLHNQETWHKVTDLTRLLSWLWCECCACADETLASF
jgi:hypothetical protein